MHPTTLLILAIAVLALVLLVVGAWACRPRAPRPIDPRAQAVIDAIEDDEGD